MKTIRLLGIWLCLVILTLPSYAQRNDVMLTNSQSIDNNPYEGVEGSPFYFDNWQKGKIYPKSNKEAIQEVILNFNGYTQSFEIKKGNRFIALDEQWYEKVEIGTAADLITFQIGLLSSDNKHFTRAVFVGNSFHLVQDFNVNGNQLIPVCVGEYRPVASNETAEGKEANRRTLLLVENKY